MNLDDIDSFIKTCESYEIDIHNDEITLESLFKEINSTDYNTTPANESALLLAVPLILTMFDIGKTAYLRHKRNKAAKATKSSVSLLTKWKESIFGSDVIAYSALGKSLVAKNVIKIDDKTITIKNINCQKLILRIREFYGERRLDLMFDRWYNNNDWKRFQKKKINRSVMHIDSLSSPIFFALELATLFKELYKEYRSPVYAIIAKQIYENTWLKKADLEDGEDISLTNLNKFNVEFEPYQQEFIKIYDKLKSHLNLNGYILAFEQGMGKTLTAYGLAECKNVDKIYIVCPNTLKDVWKTEARDRYKKYKDNPALLDEEVFICDKGKTPSDKAKIFITNNENIPIIYPYAKKCKSILIVDESHNFRNGEGKRTEELLNLAKRLNTTDILLMSGTPIKATPNEIIPALLLIDPLFTLKAADMYNKCFKLDTTMAMSMVQERFGYVIYRKTKDEMTLPNKRIISLPVSISDPDQYSLSNINVLISKLFDEIYTRRLKDNDKLKKEFIDLVNKYSSSSKSDKNHYINLIIKTVNVDQGIYVHELDKNFMDTYLATYVKPNIKDQDKIKRIEWLETNFIRMEQSSMGQAIGAILPKKRTKMYIEMFDQNFNKIAHMIQSNTRKTVIFSQFRHVVDHICDALNANGIKTVKVVGGDTSRSDVIDSFKNDDDIQVIIATSQTMGTGVTLIEANQMFFFGPPWRSSDFDQCCDRIHRIGQTSDVTIYNVILNSDKKNLSSRMQDILEWSNSMFHTAVDQDDITGANEAILNNDSIDPKILDARNSKNNPYFKIDKFYHGMNAKALVSIPKDTLIATNVVWGPVDAQLGKMSFTLIADSVCSHPLSQGGTVYFIKRIEKNKEYYDLYATKNMKPGALFTYDASDYMPDFFKRME
jgi:SNF2 family DNA or RNA helicase